MRLGVSVRVAQSFFQNEIQTFYNNAVLSANDCTLWFGLGVVVESSGKAA